MVRVCGVGVGVCVGGERERGRGGVGSDMALSRGK